MTSPTHSNKNTTLELPFIETKTEHETTDLQLIVGELKDMQAKATGCIVLRDFKDPSNKWITRSALQKAIRRGEIDVALKCTEYMLGTDPEYYWHSMSTIAIEDIGPLAPDIVTYCTALGTSAIVRKQLGNQKLVAELMVMQSCDTIKTRACCELSLSGDLFHKAVGHELYPRTDNALLKLLDQPSLSVSPEKLKQLYEMYYALGLMRGKVAPPNATTPKRPKSEDALQKVSEVFGKWMPEEQARAANLSYEKVRDSMFLAYYPIWMLVTEMSVAVMDDVMPEVTKLKGLPSYAFDLHTSTGKKALKAFHTSLKKDYPVMKTIADEKVVGSMGATVFVEEGGLERNRIMNPTLQAVKDQQDLSFMVCQGVPAEHCPEIREIVKAEIPRLNEKRKWAVEWLQ